MSDEVNGQERRVVGHVGEVHSDGTVTVTGSLNAMVEGFAQLRARTEREQVAWWLRRPETAMVLGVARGTLGAIADRVERCEHHGVGSDER